MLPDGMSVWLLSSKPRSLCSREEQSLNAAQGPIPASLVQALRYK